MSTRSQTTRGQVQPNVLLIVADTARVDDAYASNPTIMPTLQSLSSEGTRFTSAFASAPWTLPSHAGLFTGTYSSKHGAHGDHPRLESDFRTIAEAFAANGYETHAASNNTWISAEFGFDRGFDQFWKGWQLIQSEADVGAILHELGPARRAKAGLKSIISGNPLTNGINACYNHVYRTRGDYGAERTTSHIEDWLRTRDSSRPFFGFINYLEPHIRYRPPAHLAEPFLPNGATYREARKVRQDPRAYDVGAYDLSTHELSLLRGLYRGELAHVDAQISRLRSVLRDIDAWDDTILFILGDHGENIGDHGFLGHQYNLYDTVLHVPLVVTGGAFTDGGVRNDLVQLTDLAATFLDLPGIEDEQLSAQTQGESVYPGNTREREHIIAEYMAPQPPTAVLEARYGELPSHAHQFDRKLRTIRTETRKVIRGSDGHIECFHIDTDPGEQRDQSDRDIDTVSRLLEQLETWDAGFESSTASEDVQISRGAERRLADLGYL